MKKTKFAAGAAAWAWVAVMSANQAPQGAPPQGRGAQPQPIVPVSVSVLTTLPDKYVGGPVSLTAAVEQRYGPTAFSIDQDSTKSTADVLVLAPVLTAPVEPNSYVTVIGEVVRFDLSQVTARMKDATPALPPEVVEKYRGRPAIIATSVINNAMTDLAKRLPPPLTPEERALNIAMKQIGPSFNALRQSVTASSAADVKAQAMILNQAFTDAAAFWKTKPHVDAIQLTEDAKRESGAIADAAGRSDWDAVKASVPKLQSTCANCHAAYRERLDDGSYRYRAR
jgi:hypothetical protein